MLITSIYEYNLLQEVKVSLSTIIIISSVMKEVILSTS